jgi:putative ABC transport system ATP-binding protein
MSVIQINGLHKLYGDGDSQVRALDGVSLTVDQGEYVAIMGASGSGKSTMMNLLGCLDIATLGDYLINGINVKDMSENQLAQIRNRYIGFVFQSFNLIPRVSALGNVEMPMAYAGVPARERKQRAMAALTMVGLSERALHLPNELSGGQQQRVAVARSLVNAPALILADEPTGNLDSQSTADVLGIFDRLNDQGRTIVLITHEDEVAARARRILRMKDGKIVFDSRTEVVAA